MIERKLVVKEAVVLADACQHCNNLLTKHECAAYTRIKGTSDSICVSLENAADVQYIQQRKQACYMLTRRGVSSNQVLYERNVVSKQH